MICQQGVELYYCVGEKEFMTNIARKRMDVGFPRSQRASVEFI